MNKIHAAVSVLLLALLVAGAAYFYLVKQPQITKLDSDNRKVNETLTTTAAENVTLKQQVAQLTCKGRWENGACAPYTATLTATPLSGTSTLKVTFNFSVPDMNYTIDFGDGSSGWISGGLNAQAAGTCVPNEKTGLCSVSLTHTYSAKTSDATFAVKLLKDGAAVSTASIAVKKHQ